MTIIEMQPLRHPADGTDLSMVLRAMANHDRMAVLSALLDQSQGHRHPLNISQVARQADLTRFAASRHLTILVDAGLVARVQVGQSSFHSLIPFAFEQVEEWLIPFLDALSAPASARP